MEDLKWCESWEKDFDNAFKAIGKFKDDIRHKPTDLSVKTQKRVKAYIDLLVMELEEIQEKIVISKEYPVKSDNS